MSNIFLATTALEDFWDTSLPIVFLGEWCKRYSRRAFWQKLDGQTVLDPWTNGRKIEEDSRQVKTLYEKTLSHLTQSLNRLHGINASNRYWRILLGPWLLDYLPAIHNGMVILKAAKSQFPDLTTILLAKESFITPRNSLEFDSLISEDIYNLQLYTKILSFLGGDFPEKKKKLGSQFPGAQGPSILCKQMNVRWWARQFLKKMSRIFNNAPAVILVNSYFSRPTMVRLSFKSRGLVWPLFQESIEAPYLPLETDKRRRLMDGFLASSELEHLMAQTLPEDLPQSFVEAFQYLKKTVEEQYPRTPNVIFSANAWHHTDDFKQWAASQAEAGTLLVGAQHGGNYGSLLHHPSEEHELAILDRFYSWGWKNGSHKIKPFVSTKLTAIKKMKADSEEKSILFVTTGQSRYPLSLSNNSPTQFSHYFSWQSRFLKSLSPSLRRQIRLRPHYVDYGWDVKERWKEMLPEVSVENWSIPFLKSLKKCRLYVCDHLSTTFIEALAAEKPTILFWDFDVNPLRPEAQPFYDALCSVNVLHRSPESAGKHLTSVYHDVPSWWNSPQCLKVRQEFCRGFARTSGNAVQIWADEFNQMRQAL